MPVVRRAFLFWLKTVAQKNCIVSAIESFRMLISDVAILWLGLICACPTARRSHLPGESRKPRDRKSAPINGFCCNFFSLSWFLSGRGALREATGMGRYY